MLVLSVLRQNGFRRIGSLLSMPDRAIVVQRMQTRKFSSVKDDVYVDFQDREIWEPNPESNMLEPPLPYPYPPDPTLTPDDYDESPQLLPPEAKVSDDPTREYYLPKVGTRPSIIEGVENAVKDAADIGAKSFAIYLKSPAEWKSPSLTPHSISEFKKRMKQYGFANNMVLPISNHRLQLGDPNSKLREKSYNCFLDDLQRCEALGLEMYNLRLGFTEKSERPSFESYHTYIADSINRAHKDTKGVTIVLKTINGEYYSIGAKFSDMAKIIAQVNDKSRVGVSLDTHSVYVAGYLMKTQKGWDETMGEFDKEIGLNYLRGMHLCDIKYQNVRKNIGLGYIGLTAFQRIIQDPRIRNIPLILGTRHYQQPEMVWRTEIEMLQVLANTPLGETEDQEALIDDLKSVVRRAKTLTTKAKRKREKKKIEKEKEMEKGKEKKESENRLPESPDDDDFF